MKFRFFSGLGALVCLLAACKTKDSARSPQVSPLPTWVESTVFYQVWPRSFQDTNGDGNGDFKGLTRRLDYLQELGVNGIWLTPVFESPSYHGYDFEDQYSVDKDYGSEEDFVEFLSEARKRGMRVIGDLVLNHISSQSEWFKKSEARDPVYDKYFMWRKELPKENWMRPWSLGSSPKDVWHWSETRKEYYYGVFSSRMPDLNLKNTAVAVELEKLAQHWMSKGFSGFRLDAARYIIEEEGGPKGQSDTEATLKYWTKFRSFTKKIGSESLLVGEVWADLPTTARYYQEGKGLSLCFDFDLGNQIVKSLGGSQPMSETFGSAGTASGKPLRVVLQENIAQKRRAGVEPGFFSPFLTNHDQDRVMRLLGDIPHKMRIASTILLTYVGSPFIYYGEEIGLKQPQGGDDLFKRSPMLWDSTPNAGFSSSAQVWVDDARWFPWRKDHKSWWAQGYSLDGAIASSQTVEGQKADPQSLWNHYRKLIALRKAHPEFQSHAGDSIRFLNSPDTALVYERKKDKARSYVVINLLDSATNLVELPESREYQDLLSDRRVQGSKVSLAAGEILILK